MKKRKTNTKKNQNRHIHEFKEKKKKSIERCELTKKAENIFQLEKQIMRQLKRNKEVVETSTT